MSFRITGLPAEDFAHLFALSDKELAARDAVRRIADERTPGYPCRVSLTDTAPGDELLLVNYEHHPVSTPYRMRFAVYVRRGEETYDTIDAVPEQLRIRTLALRGFDAKGMMVGWELIDGRQLEAAIERLFADPKAACLHVHYAGPGCYAARVDRVPKGALTSAERRSPACRGAKPAFSDINGEIVMAKEQENKAIVGRWFKEFWGNPWNPKVIEELATPDILLQYSLHAPRRGREDVKEFMTGFRDAFPDLNFWGAAHLIAEGDYVVGRWEGGGTHTGSAFSDFLAGSLPAASGRKMRFTGTTVLRVENGKIAEELGLDDGVTALQQLGLLRAA